MTDLPLHSLSSAEGKATRPGCSEGGTSGRVATSSGAAPADAAPVAGRGVAPGNEAAGIGFPRAVPAVRDVRNEWAGVR